MTDREMLINNAKKLIVSAHGDGAVADSRAWKEDAYKWCQDYGIERDKKECHCRPAEDDMIEKPADVPCEASLRVRVADCERGMLLHSANTTTEITALQVQIQNIIKEMQNSYDGEFGSTFIEGIAADLSELNSNLDDLRQVVVGISQRLGELEGLTTAKVERTLGEECGNCRFHAPSSVSTFRIHCDRADGTPHHINDWCGSYIAVSRAGDVSDPVEAAEPETPKQDGYPPYETRDFSPTLPKESPEIAATCGNCRAATSLGSDVVTGVICLHDERPRFVFKHESCGGFLEKTRLGDK